MTQPLAIGVDLGTTAVKAGAFSPDGRALGVASREFSLDSPAPGRLEFDADRYLALAFDCIREALRKANAPVRAVKAVGFSSQAQTFVVVDALGRPVRPAVSWLDVRAEDEARELSAEAARVGGEPIGAIESAPKLLWLRRHEPDAMSRASRVLLLPDYFIFRLTGRAVTDPVTASSTGFYDIRAGRWALPLVSACGLREEMLSEVLYAGEPAGCLTAEAVKELGLSADTVVAVGTNDQLVGAVGAGNVTPGCASMALGTALAIVVTNDRPAGLPGPLGFGLHPVRGLYTALAFAKTSGIVLRWFRDTMTPGLSYEEIFREALTAPIGADGLVCLPHFAGTATPTFIASARGAFAGLTLTHTRAHLARAVVESLTFTIRENLELLAAAAGGVREVRTIGGGARSDAWLQMIADAAGVTVERPATTEAACLGAAVLGFVAAKVFPSVADGARAVYRAERRFVPDVSHRAQWDEAFARYRALYRTLYGCS